MNETSAPNSTIQTEEADFPRCAKCNKPVERLTIMPYPNHPGKVIVEFRCHGECVEQEMSSSILRGEQGLSAYTAFNEYISGLMPH